MDVEEGFSFNLIYGYYLLKKPILIVLISVDI